MKALVTGSAGFIGRHMFTELWARGYTTDRCDLASGNDCVEYFRCYDEVYDLVVHCAYHVGGRAAIDGEPRLLARNLEHYHAWSRAGVEEMLRAAGFDPVVYCELDFRPCGGVYAFGTWFAR